MAVNLSSLVNPLKSALNPVSAISEKDNTPVPLAPQSSFNQDPIQSATSHGNEIQRKIDEHIASQSAPIQSPSIDFSSAISGETAKTNFMGNINRAPAPTGGGMMPPTPEAKPLSQTPKIHPMIQESSSGFIPTASASGDTSTIGLHLFPEEKTAYEKMKQDGVSDMDAKSAIQYNRAEKLKYSGLDSKLTPKESLGLTKMIQDGVSMSDAIASLKESRDNPKQDTFFKDQHPDEVPVEQALRATYRAPIDTAKAIWQGFGGATQNFLNMGLRATNDLNKVFDAVAGTNYYSPTLDTDIQKETGSTGYLGDVTGVTKGASQTAFNTVKAPMATGLNLASELPGTQYIMQGLSKAIEGTGKKLSDVTGIDNNTMQNIIATGMNVLGTKMPEGGSVESGLKAAEAFKEAPSVKSGLFQAGKSLAGDVVKSTGEVAKLPYDLAKSGINKLTGNIKVPGIAQDFVPAKTEGGTEFTVESTPGIVKNTKDILFNKDNETLAQQSVFPKQTKAKTPQARVESARVALDGIKQLYEDKAKGIVISDIHDMGGGVEGVAQALDAHGKKIGELTKNDATVNVSDLVAPLKESLNSKFSGINSSMKSTVQNIVNEFERVKNTANIEELQNALSNIKSEIFDNKENVAKLYKTNTGRALNDFLKAVEDRLNKTIDETSGKSAELKSEKSAYSRLKKIQGDMTDSYMVELRNQGKGATGTAGKIAGLYEVLHNPSISGIFKAIALKEAGETMQYYKSRAGNYETLIRNLDREAISRNQPANGNTRTNLGNLDNKKPIK